MRGSSFRSQRCMALRGRNGERRRKGSSRGGRRRRNTTEGGPRRPTPPPPPGHGRSVTRVKGERFSRRLLQMRMAPAKQEEEEEEEGFSLVMRAASTRQRLVLRLRSTSRKRDL